MTISGLSFRFVAVLPVSLCFFLFLQFLPVFPVYSCVFPFLSCFFIFLPVSSSFFCFFPVSSRFNLFLPVSSCFFLFLPVFLMFLPVSSCFFPFLPFLPSFFPCLPVFSCFFLFLPVSSCCFLLFFSFSPPFLLVSFYFSWFLSVCSHYSCFPYFSWFSIFFCLSFFLYFLWFSRILFDFQNPLQELSTNCLDLVYYFNCRAMNGGQGTSQFLISSNQGSKYFQPSEKNFTSWNNALGPAIESSLGGWSSGVTQPGWCRRTILIPMASTFSPELLWTLWSTTWQATELSVTAQEAQLLMGEQKCRPYFQSDMSTIFQDMMVFHTRARTSTNLTVTS